MKDQSSLNELRFNCSVKQKKGLHFILASVVVWSVVFLVHLTNMPILTKNFITFCCTAPLMPIAYLISRFIHVDFQNKENPLTNLGILFSLNQMLYLLIAMWVYPTVPEKMLMVIAMIFGAHLLPYGWLYQSKTYTVMAVLIPILALWIGCNFASSVLAGSMVVIEIVFCLSLIIENQKISVRQAAEQK